MKKTTQYEPSTVSKKYLLPFIIITSLFALWGFANDITNPMVAAFKSILELSNFKASLVQFSFYGGYTLMAIPAALFIRKKGYKAGILIGLGLYALGAFLFFPAASMEVYSLFLISYCILTFGLAFLETTANPYILAMGDPSTATRRLNFAQAFNPMGSLIGMFVASKFVLAKLASDDLDVHGNLIYPTLPEIQKAAIRTSDLSIIRNPYVIIGFVVLAVFFLILFTKMPNFHNHINENKAIDSFKRLFHNKTYLQGVLTQIFYVGAQIMCWTYIIFYCENLGIEKSTAQDYNIIAMGCFLSMRFVGTYLMKFFDSAKLLGVFALGGIITISCVIFIGGIFGLICLIATSVFMSIMFPTIYGQALDGLTNDDATIGASGLVMAIVGGSFMPLIQGKIMDLGGKGLNDIHIFGYIPEVNFSFILPFICFIVILSYSISLQKKVKNI